MRFREYDSHHGQYTWHFLLVALAGWMNRQQQEMIEYLENRILREKLGPGRIQLTVAQKRRLATAAMPAPSSPIPISQRPSTAALPPPFLPPSTGES
jgi:hypothetical protein